MSNRWKVFFYFWISRILGITFGIKLMERGEERAQINYEIIARKIPKASQIIADEHAHEQELIGLIEEERLNYVGSIVLGLNDALVELTGALAGFTFALQNTRLIALAGLITGIAASFSMAASEYLSTKSEGSGERALKSSIYTGAAYIVTVILLILPYLLVNGTARIVEGGAPELLRELAAVMITAEGVQFPPADAPPGYVTRIKIDSVGGVGPWAG